MNRRESDRKVDVICYGMNGKYTSPRVAHPEEPGEFCFPPFASLITGAARLMLAVLEFSVREGTYAMEDTDSMAIVATERGGTVSIPSAGTRNTSVQTLSWKQVDEISQQFAALNPYRRDAVPGSILKIEDDNYDPATKKQRRLWCFAISAKRYALFLCNQDGVPVLLRSGENNPEDRWSEHGLGHLLNPTDPEDEDREWIAKVWLNIVRGAQRLPVEKLGFEESPAIGRITISSPTVMRPLTALNTGKT